MKAVVFLFPLAGNQNGISEHVFIEIDIDISFFIPKKKENRLK